MLLGVPEGLRKFPVHNPRQWRAILKIRLQNGFLASKMLFPPDFFRNYGAELIFDTELVTLHIYVRLARMNDCQKEGTKTRSETIESTNHQQG